MMAKSPSEIERKERANALYQSAMAEFESGRADAAVAAFEKLLRTDPGNFLAHFQLAVILQDSKRDYVGAIAHYREYAALRPEAEKSTVAMERAEACMSLLQADLIAKAATGDNAVTRKIDSLTAERDSLQAANSKMTAELAGIQRRIAALEQENAMQKRMIARFSSEGDGDKPAGISREALEKAAGLDKDDGAASSGAAKAALARIPDVGKDDSEISAHSARAAVAANLPDLGADDNEKPREIPTDEALLDDDGESAALGRREDIRRLRAELEEEEKEPVPPSTKPIVKPPAGPPKRAGETAQTSEESSRPSEYVVQPGDTLMGIAQRFYGSRNEWHRIREANKAEVPPNGAIKLGQTLKLP